MYLVKVVFTCMPDESHRGRLRSLLRYVFSVLINSLGC